jgi:cell wall-associated NlpC family hydrolase
VAAQGAFSRREQPFTTISRMFLASGGRDSLVSLATSQVGARYRWGAAVPGVAFDCSGLVQWVMANFNIALPRTSREQALAGLEIPKDPGVLLPGDLLFFGKTSRVDHVGIYIGEGRYVHAANRRKGVIVSNLPTGRSARTWWKGVRRLIANEEEIASLPMSLMSPAGMRTGT